MQNGIVDLGMIWTAKQSLSSLIRKTPLTLAPDQMKGGCDSLYIKCENLQVTGSFKSRGAANRIFTLSEEEKARGVIAASAGNHAQGVALASKNLGIRSVIVMPAGAPIYKVTQTRSYGAEVVLFGSGYDEAYEKAREIAEKENLVFIHPFDDPYVIAGQGTIGIEILEDLNNCDTIIVPIGGGGLAAGVAVAAKSLKPGIRVVGAEPKDAASMLYSRNNNAVSEISSAVSLADGVAVKKPGNLTFELCQKYLDDIVTVTEDEIAAAILQMLERMKLVSEGAGAVAVAAASYGNSKGYGKTAAIVSGGNIDVNILERVIEKGLIKSGRRLTFSTIMEDKPGALGHALAIISECGANIMSVNHNRLSRDTGIKHVIVSIELETRDDDHAREIFDTLKSNGYSIVQN